MRPTTLERFMDSAGPRPETPEACWIWQGTMHQWGYGRFYMLGKNGNAHRAAYKLFVGDPGDLYIDHLCRNRRCVNPFHLEAVTSRENILRGEGQAAIQARWTRCPHGHEFTPENTMRRKDGSRRCGACERERWRRENAKRFKGTKRVAQHGTESKYTGGCRCELCRAAHAATHREYRRKKREGAA